MNKTFTIFGREPALVLALAAAVIYFVSLFLFDLSPEQQGVLNLVVGAIVAVVGALKVARDKVAAALLGLAQSAVGAAVAFGLHLGAEQQAGIMVLAATVIGFFARTQVTAPVDANGNKVVAS